jgi:hypothetical protein
VLLFRVVRQLPDDRTLATICQGLRAGVAQASGDGFAVHAMAVVHGAEALAILARACRQRQCLAGALVTDRLAVKVGANRDAARPSYRAM